MTWYLAVYLLFFVVVGIAGLIEDYSARRNPLFIGGMVIALFVGVLSVAAFAFPRFNDSLGAWSWPLIVFAISIEVVSLVADIGDLSRDDETSRPEVVAVTLVTVAMTIPAYVLGVIALARPGVGYPPQ